MPTRVHPLVYPAEKGRVIRRNLHATTRSELADGGGLQAGKGKEEGNGCVSFGHGVTAQLLSRQHMA